MSLPDKYYGEQNLRLAQKMLEQQGEVNLLRERAKLAEAAITRVRELHKPEVPPEGSQWVSGGRDAHCAGCSTGDPFLDQPWPCPTITALDGGE